MRKIIYNQAQEGTQKGERHKSNHNKENSAQNPDKSPRKLKIKTNPKKIKERRRRTPSDSANQTPQPMHHK